MRGSAADERSTLLAGALAMSAFVIFGAASSVGWVDRHFGLLGGVGAAACFFMVLARAHRSEDATSRGASPRLRVERAASRPSHRPIGRMPRAVQVLAAPRPAGARARRPRAR